MTFDEWWAKDGRFYDPDTDDVPWFDKRKELAAVAFTAGAGETKRQRDRLLAALKAYVLICGNTCAVVSCETARELWEEGQAAIAEAEGGEA
jgi:hypothetical protein